ncbi:hypothetical protein [Streptacidiphilus cavernicola]|uniref:Alpha/beta hydrolase n=1 Tax=Streptacidiphilus cavernicola TaxID=3342716 RepID=A0ABV6VX17_9ACTN
MTPHYLGAVLRAAAAALALGGVLTGSLALVLAPDRGAPAALSADARPAARPLVHPLATTPKPTTPKPTGAKAVPPKPSGGGPSSRPSPAAATALVTIGHPSGGELLQGTLAGFPGRVQVWLPKQYRGRTVPLQAVLVFAAPAELGDVFAGLSGAVDTGKANPVVAVVPAATCSPSGAVDPAFTADVLRRAAVSRFHVATSPAGWAVLGLDGGAPCAVAAELAQPTAFRAAAGLGGRYGALPDPAAPSPSPAGTGSVATGRVHLLLADAQRDTAGQRSASALGTVLARQSHIDVRLSSAVRDFTPSLERFRLVRVAAGYFAEQFAAPAR